MRVAWNFTARAGHAPTLPRQHEYDHVSRPNNHCSLWHYVDIFVVASSFRHPEAFTFFSYFFYSLYSSITVSHCRCREAKPISRGQRCLLPLACHSWCRTGSAPPWRRGQRPSCPVKQKTSSEQEQSDRSILNKSSIIFKCTYVQHYRVKDRRI